MDVRRLVVLFTAMAVGFPCAVLARSALDEARNLTQAADTAARSSQQRINKLDDQTQSLLEQYRAALRQSEQLDTYIKQVQPLLAQQKSQIAQLNGQIAHQGDIAEQILPLMLKMTDSLGKFVALDLPFLTQERSDRIANLKLAMADGSVSLAGKFKRLAQAYQVEADYGRSLGVDRQDIVVGGQHKVVDILRVGRVVLLYETPDSADTGYWDQGKHQWVSLDGDYARDIREGLKIAKGNLAAAPLPLPVPTPTTEAGR